MKSLVTGATGFIGSHLVEALLKRGENVRCLVRKSSDRSFLKQLPCELFDGDISDRESLIPAVQGVDVIYHLGGITKAKSEAAYFKVNADASRMLYEVCAEYNPGIKKIVHVSSLAAAGPSRPDKPRVELDPSEPITFYGKSKWEGEKFAIAYMKSMPICVIRPPAVYGPREKDIFFYFQLIQNHIRPVLGFGKKYLSLIHAYDLVEAIIAAGQSQKSNGQIYFVDDGSIYTWQELSAGIQDSLNTWAAPVVIPEWVISAVAGLAEFFSMFSKNPVLLNRQKVIELKQSAWTCSSEKIRHDLGWKSAFNLTDGLQNTVSWYRQERWL